MNMLLVGKSALRRVLPKSTFWQFFLATACVGVLTALAAMVVAFWISRGLVHKMMEETGYTVLSNAVDFIGRSRSNLEQYRVVLFDADKELLRTVTDNAYDLFDAFRNEAVSVHLSLEEAQKAALDQLHLSENGTRVRLLVLDSNNHVLEERTGSHSRHKDTFEGSRVPEVLLDMIRQAREASDGETIKVYQANQDDTLYLDMHLALARYYAPWDLVLIAELDWQDNAVRLREQERTQLDELRARMGEIVLGKSGYVFALDQNCDVMVHPTLTGANMAGMDPISPGQSLCRSFQETAIKPWGSNSIAYDWDRVGQPGKYVFSKIAWCTREPTTGWYVGASVYVEEMEEDLPRYVLLIFFPALGAILILGGTLALLLRNLLRPVHNLTMICQDVSGGNLDATAPEDAPGEVGFLAQHFNVMIRTIRELINLDALRQKELEALNRSLETKVQERTQDLKQKTEKLEEANLRLLELDKLKSALLSSVSHELRTPLTSIMGFAKLIERDFQHHAKDAEQSDNPRLHKIAKRIDKNLDIINTEAERLTRLINELLDLSSVESGRAQMHDRLFNFTDILGPCLSRLDQSISENPDVLICIEISEELPPLLADMDRLQQVVYNIIDNALKFTQQGHITISACASDGWIQVRIKDTGIGMDKKNLLQVFESFHQVGFDEEMLIGKPQGSGLGLSLCLSVIKRYDGIIWCESEPGKGTEVVFEMPSAIVRE